MVVGEVSDVEEEKSEEVRSDEEVFDDPMLMNHIHYSTGQTVVWQYPEVGPVYNVVQVPVHEVDPLGDGGLSLDPVHGRCFQSWYQRALDLVDTEVEV